MMIPQQLRSPVEALDHLAPRWLWLAGAASFCLSAYYIFMRCFSSLAGIPGPRLAVLSRLWMVFHTQQGQMHRLYPRLHAKYGKLVRVAPNEVSVSDLDAIRQIYGPGSKFVKSDWYSVWQGTQKTDIFAERDISVHSNLKKNVSRIYSMSNMTSLEKWVDDAIACFILRMHDQGSKPVNLGTWLQILAFDVIGELTFSRRFGFLEAGKDDGTFQRIELALQSLAWVGQMPWLFWIHHYLSPYIGSYLNLSLRQGALRQYASREVQNRKGRSTEHNDILGELYRVAEEKPGSLDENSITSLALANVFAGSDTTSISLRAIIYFLLKNPPCLERLRSEMDERIADGRLTFPIPFSQVSDWPYLQACISESLRLHPAVGMCLPRVVPPGGTTIDGKFLPSGIVVGVNAWVVHRDPTVFGYNVNKFDPTRWLASDKGNKERFFFAFGGGQRLCIGKNISLMEMGKLIPTFFTEFDVSLTNPGQPLKELCAWFVQQDGLYVNLKPRRR